MKYPLLSKTFAVALVVIVLGLVLARIEALVGERKMRLVRRVLLWRCGRRPRRPGGEVWPYRHVF